jgi:hypothetical protein
MVEKEVERRNAGAPPEGAPNQKKSVPPSSRPPPVLKITNPVWSDFIKADMEGEPFGMALLWKKLSQDLSEEDIVKQQAHFLHGACETKLTRFNQMKELIQAGVCNE